MKDSEAVALLMKLFQELPLKVRREIADLLTRPNPLTAKRPKKRGGK